jgi:hypothetical protein
MNSVYEWLRDAFGPTGPTEWGRFWTLVLAAIAVFGLVMWGLHQLSPRAKKWLTIVLTFLAGCYFLLEYFLPVHDAGGGEMVNRITKTVPPVSDFVVVVMVWTLLVGLVSLGAVHGKRLLRREPGWHNSLALYLAFFAIVLVGFGSHMGTQGAFAVGWSTLYNGVLVNLDSAMFALLAFYISSAAYRAFRVRSVEAVLLMISAVIVMLGFVSMGIWLTRWLPEAWRMDQSMLWILQVLNMPVQRAVTIGVSIGALAMALRIWLSLERGAFFSQEG